MPASKTLLTQLGIYKKPKQATYSDGSSEYFPNKVSMQNKMHLEQEHK